MKKRNSNLPPFDDFLGLSRQGFEDVRLVLFHGMSGSGKSSCLHFLAYHHPFFRNQSIHWIWTKHKRVKVHSIQAYDLVVIDEIVSPFQLFSIHKLLKSNKTVAIASHIHPAWYRLFFSFKHTRSYQTDASTKNLSAYLNRNGIYHSQPALRQFSKQYGSNYVDLNCILDAHPGKDFDNAFESSKKFNTIKSFKPDKWEPSLPRLKFD